MCYNCILLQQLKLILDTSRGEVIYLVQVTVHTNNIDQALRALKKKMQREGIFREMKLRRHFEKPSEEKKRKNAESDRRRRKLARKKNMMEN